MTLSTRQTAVIHAAKAQLKLTDRRYRSLLRRAAGVASSTELEAEGFRAVMREFERLGFRNPNRVYPANPGQVGLIRRLWRDYHGGEGDDLALSRWLQTKFKADLTGLPRDAARRAIGALKQMLRRK